MDWQRITRRYPTLKRLEQEALAAHAAGEGWLDFIGRVHSALTAALGPTGAADYHAARRYLMRAFLDGDVADVAELCEGG